MAIYQLGDLIPTVDPEAYVHPDAVVIGDVTIGAESTVWPSAVLRGDYGTITVGARTSVQDGTVIHVAREGQGTEIGSGVMIGHMAMIHACTIKDNAMIGMTACIMDEAVVETGAMVAAGAFVSPKKVVGSGEVWAGRPAKFWRMMSEQDLYYFHSGVEHYYELGREYRTGEPHSRPWEDRKG